MEMIGKTLGSRYEILEKIGEGGMAIVYKARCHLLNRFVAIKILKSEYARDEVFVKRFRAEAQSAASLTHPNIVSVYDVGQEDDGNINYIVMELLESKSLKDYIVEHGAMDSEDVLKISAQVASALEAAHKAHIIHRDIKPHNIILNKNMVAKVTDFGIAKITNTTSATIATMGITMGSVHYFSPEHAKGGYTDEKSDIYSLGVVMYEMATGKLPFDADTPVSVALKHVQEIPKEPIELNNKIPIALNQIILKAMAKNTAERYQNATELLSDISSAITEPNKLSPRNSSIGVGATQVIPTLNLDGYDEYRVPNLRTREARRMNVVSSKEHRSNTDKNNSNVNENEDKKQENKKDVKSSKKKIVVIVILVIILLTAFIVGTVFAIKIYKRVQAERASTKQLYTIPNLVGRLLSDVVVEYAAQGIQVEQENVVFSSEFAEGYIVSQSIEKGTVTENNKVYVVVSKGQKMVEVPDEVNKDIKVAKYELEDTLGFKIEIEEVINEKILAGIIISQEPDAKTVLPYGSTIKLKVSKGDGKQTVLVPGLVGKKEAEAKKLLEDRKLKVNVKYGEDKSKANGVVLTQSYPENQELKEGDLVEITINKLLLSKNISIDLLELQGGKLPEEETTINVKVMASIDGGASNPVYEKSLKSTDKTAVFKINGYNTAKLDIYLNDKKVKEMTIEFK